MDVFVNGGCYFVDWFGWGALDSVFCANIRVMSDMHMIHMLNGENIK